ncbi:MAG: 8-oxo-dGTP diphosphatase [Lachnospiraceae bacterium]|nr:8-oxo-dGTP diphosphatase [Lachnospiraceae bacterium]
MGHSTENVELTVLCLIQDKNRILLQNRVKEDWKGYTFPGGHVEPGESFVDAVKREMKEETGLDIIRPQLVGVKQFPIENGRYIVLLFKTAEFSGDVVSSDEGEMEWVDIEKLSEVNVVEDFHDLMKVLNNPEINEFQYTVEGDEWIVHLK